MYNALLAGVVYTVTYNVSSGKIRIEFENLLQIIILRPTIIDFEERKLIKKTYFTRQLILKCHYINLQSSKERKQPSINIQIVQNKTQLRREMWLTSLPKYALAQELREFRHV